MSCTVAMLDGLVVFGGEREVASRGKRKALSTPTQQSTKATINNKK